MQLTLETMLSGREVRKRVTCVGHLSVSDIRIGQKISDCMKKILEQHIYFAQASLELLCMAAVYVE